MKPHAPLMSELAGGLEQDQAARRIEQIDPAARLVARQGVVVPVGVLTAERKLESTLAVSVAVAHAGIAASLA